MDSFEDYKVKIYVGVNYCDTDLVKQKGAKWDMREKKCSFIFPLNEFINNKTLHTYQFKPFNIGISIFYAKENGEVARVQLIGTCYRIAKDRNTEYLEEMVTTENS